MPFESLKQETVVRMESLSHMASSASGVERTPLCFTTLSSAKYRPSSSSRN